MVQITAVGAEGKRKEEWAKKKKTRSSTAGLKCYVTVRSEGYDKWKRNLVP